MPPRPRRFQLHLSTCIALMFAAGGLIWANVSETVEPGISDIGDPDETHFEIHTQGWPLQILWYSGGIEGLELDFYTRFALDLFIAIAILATIAFICEWRIRRRRAVLPLPSEGRGPGG